MIKSSFVEITDSWLFDAKPSAGVRVFTSLEGENPGGSIKDHMVLGELERLLTLNRLRPGEWIAEISSGSTARSLAFYSRQLHLRCCLFLPATASPEQIQELSAMGAHIRQVDASDIKKAYLDFESFSRSHSYHRFDQMSDPGKRLHYHGLGDSIQASIGPVSLVLGAVGTGHSLLGVAERIPSAEAFTAEPLHGSVPGIRNLDSKDWLQDPNRIIEQVAGRYLIDPTDKFPGKTVQTSAGEISISESFAVVLGAARKALSKEGHECLFLVGASNRNVPRQAGNRRNVAHENQSQS